jgi:hypothetical protein
MYGTTMMNGNKELAFFIDGEKLTIFAGVDKDKDKE